MRKQNLHNMKLGETTAYGYERIRKRQSVVSDLKLPSKYIMHTKYTTVEKRTIDSDYSSPGDGALSNDIDLNST
eukprot:7343017-Ditylum_brightwellii.AAC.1